MRIESGGSLEKYHKPKSSDEILSAGAGGSFQYSGLDSSSRPEDIRKFMAEKRAENPGAELEFDNSNGGRLYWRIKKHNNKAA